ncbi:MAG: hypothetical protein ABI721_04060 [Candidatus Dojkabacteria bacterium]
MKILATVPEVSNDKILKTFLEAVKILKKQGHNVTEIKADNSKKSADLAKAFNQIDKYIKDTDILITDVTNADSKVGYEVARALDEKKVVIALEEEKSKNQFVVIHGNKNRQIVHAKYNAKNIETVIADVVKEASSRLDSKFILIISPEMDRYLNWASKVKRTHKAQVVRTALEALIKKDKEYKDYVQGE